MSDALAMGRGLIDPRYCCCAIPLVNAGIYAVLGEQGVLSIAVGILIFATPDVVGASYPAYGGIILAIICFAVAAVQPMGFIGVLREKTATFKFYVWINSLLILAAFVCAAALIITSALKHKHAVTTCEQKFFTDSGNSSTSANETLSAESEKLCSAFAWADVGIMGGLWVILFLVQGYFIYLTRVYSKSQVSDHKLYHSVYSENPEAFTMSILRSSRYNPGSVYNTMPGPNADAWDTRPSMESLRGETTKPNQTRYLDDNHRQPGYEDASPDQHNPPTYYNTYAPAEHSEGNYPFTAPGGGYVSHPAEPNKGYAGAVVQNGLLKRPMEAHGHSVDEHLSR
ncbi:hypothetical protein L204_104333 [Cryptococcus depauperatus]